MRMIVGIDPGAKGGICFLHNNETTEVQLMAMPVVEVVENKKKKQKLDIARVQHLLNILKGTDAHIFMEKLWASNPQKGTARSSGITSTWSQAMMYGELHALLVVSGVPFTLVPAVTWKNKILKGFGDMSFKGCSIARCKQLFPGINLVRPGCRTDHDGMAEAALIAYYGKEYASK